MTIISQFVILGEEDNIAIENGCLVLGDIKLFISEKQANEIITVLSKQFNSIIDTLESNISDLQDKIFNLEDEVEQFREREEMGI
jgi:hypothetical protein